MKTFKINEKEDSCNASVGTDSLCSTPAPENTPVSGTWSKDTNAHLPVAIIGAGPIGLAAAAHLVKEKIPFVLLENGDKVAHNIISWQHVSLFSPWEYNMDPVAKSLLEETNWVEPNGEELPTGKELRDKYLIPVSELASIRPFIQLDTKVISIARKENDKMKTDNRNKQPFVIYTERHGEIQLIEARAVIDATGTWGNPNPSTSNGVWLQAERELHEQISYGIPNISENVKRYGNKQVAVVGGGHSAINSLIELAALQEDYPNTKITWIMRKKRAEDAYGGEESDALEARGALGSRIHKLVDNGRIQVLTPFYILSVKNKDGQIGVQGSINGEIQESPLFDEMIVNAGNRPDFSLEQELRISIDSATESIEALSPLIDPNEHSCGTVRAHGEEILRQPEQGLYIVGAKSYGRAPTFLMATGYEQVRSIVSYLSGDNEAARRVELNLPETGVCSLNLQKDKEESSCSTTSCS